MANTVSANEVRIQASGRRGPGRTARPRSQRRFRWTAPRTAATTMGLPKSAMLSMNPTRKALARPGLSSGSVTVMKVCCGLARRVCAGLFQAGRHALHHAAHDHEGNRREREQGLRRETPKPAVEPARWRDAKRVLQKLVDHPARPNSRMAQATTKGGVMMGSMATTFSGRAAAATPARPSAP